MDITCHLGTIKKTPVIISKSEIDNISELIKDVIFIDADFVKSIKKSNRRRFCVSRPLPMLQKIELHL